MAQLNHLKKDKLLFTRTRNDNAKKIQMFPTGAPWPRFLMGCLLPTLVSERIPGSTTNTLY